MHRPPEPEGSSPALPDLPPFDPNDHYEQFVPKPLPPTHGKLATQIILLALTFVTTTIAGGCHYNSFMVDLSQLVYQPPGEELPFWTALWLTITDVEMWRQIGAMLSQPMFYVHGLWYSLTILAILGCHEMGHYVACLRYGVIATRPYFLPVPPFPFMTGTLGAFIRIKSRIPTKTALFDIGIAGPLAGFAVLVPSLFIGLMLSRIDRLPADHRVLQELGEPLLFKAAAWLVWGSVPQDSTIQLHPVAFAAWFGMLATALNLFPIAQLDGGHIAYAVLGRRSTIVTIVMLAAAIGLTFVSLGWVVWTILMVVMILAIGPHHPPTLYDDEPVNNSRVLLAAVAMLILIICFTPVPLGDMPQR